MKRAILYCVFTQGLLGASKRSVYTMETQRSRRRSVRGSRSRNRSRSKRIGGSWSNSRSRYNHNGGSNSETTDIRRHSGSSVRQKWPRSHGVLCAHLCRYTPRRYPTEQTYRTGRDGYHGGNRSTMMWARHAPSKSKNKNISSKSGLAPLRRTATGPSSLSRAMPQG